MRLATHAGRKPALVLHSVIIPMLSVKLLLSVLLNAFHPNLTSSPLSARQLTYFLVVPPRRPLHQRPRQARVRLQHQLLVPTRFHRNVPVAFQEILAPIQILRLRRAQHRTRTPMDALSVMKLATARVASLSRARNRLPHHLRVLRTRFQFSVDLLFVTGVTASSSCLTQVQRHPHCYFQSIRSNVLSITGCGMCPTMAAKPGSRLAKSNTRGVITCSRQSTRW